MRSSDRPCWRPSPPCARQVLIHQRTDLSGGFEPGKVAETLERNSRLRTEGTHNLVEAARAAGVRRLIAQSIAWVYAPGREPHAEDDSLDRAAVGTRAVTVQGVVALEEAVLGAAPDRGAGPPLRLALWARSQREARRCASASCRRRGERGSPGRRARVARRLQHRRARTLHRHRQGPARARVGPGVQVAPVALQSRLSAKAGRRSESSRGLAGELAGATPGLWRPARRPVRSSAGPTADRRPWPSARRRWGR